jgi:hypothetical protein
MPVKNAGIRRTGKFADVERVINSHGFVRATRPGYGPSPGFYYYGRAGFLVQILNGRRVSITRPDGQVEIVSARRLVVLDSALDCVVLEIEENENASHD